MENNQPYPWCKNIFDNLILSEKQNRFPHAILFYGNSGLGKSELAQQVAQYLLCSNPNKNNHACGTCKDCILFSAKTHGDYYLITSENNKAIGIDEIRNIKTESNQKPQRGRVKIFIITHADKMSIAASNALLKTLEEPPSGSIFILTSERKNFLSATVLSRCQHYGFISPSIAESTKWLLENNQSFSKENITQALFWSLGSPLLAQQLLDNNIIIEYESYAADLRAHFLGENSLFSLTKSWTGKSLTHILYSAQITCYHLLKFNPGDISRNMIYQWIEKIIKIKKMLATKIALNENLMLDFLLNEKVS